MKTKSLLTFSLPINTWLTTSTSGSWATRLLKLPCKAVVTSEGTERPAVYPEREWERKRVLGAGTVCVVFIENSLLYRDAFIERKTATL